MTLAELLATEPYDVMTDADAAAAINAATVSVWQDVPWLELGLWAHAQLLTRAALETAATSGTDANRTAAQHVLDCLNAGQPLSARDSRIRDLVAASSLSGPAKQALVTLATTTAPLVSTLTDHPYPAVTEGDVAARRAP